MAAAPQIRFVDNPIAAARRDHYVEVTVDVTRILKSWRSSLHAFEWMLPDGRIKSRDELPPREQPKRDEVDARIGSGQPLEKPVLGIGLLENVEIGSGRAVFLTAAAAGLKIMPVHIPVSNSDEFRPFIAS